MNDLDHDLESEYDLRHNFWIVARRTGGASMLWEEGNPSEFVAELRSTVGDAGVVDGRRVQLAGPAEVFVAIKDVTDTINSVGGTITLLSSLITTAILLFAKKHPDREIVIEPRPGLTIRVSQETELTPDEKRFIAQTFLGDIDDIQGFNVDPV